MGSPGNSTQFSVYGPDINLEDSRWVKIEYKDSKVRFFRILSGIIKTGSSK